MAVYIKIDDPAKYYQPTLVTDAATDRVDEIAVGSNGGGKGYIANSGQQDAPMTLVVGERKLMEVTQGFAFLLGSFSGVWAGVGQVKIKLIDASNRVFFKEFLTDNPLSSYSYAVYLSVVDAAGNMVNKPLSVTSEYDSTLQKYKHTFSLNASVLTFGTTGVSSPLADLSKVSVYLRGYFYETNHELVEYIGGGYELDAAPGGFPLYLRGIAGKSWRVSAAVGNIYFYGISSGTFPSNGVEFMPKSEQIPVTISSNYSTTQILRAGIIAVVRTGSNENTLDYVPISQKSSASGSLDVSMRTIRIKGVAGRTLKLKIFDKQNHGWSLSVGTGSAFISLSRSSGTGTTTVNVTISNAVIYTARYGIITLTDSTNSQTYQIPVVQLCTERYFAVEETVSGQAKTIKAYAATVVKVSFEMEVSYYNAPSFALKIRQLGFNINDFAAGTNGLATLNMKSGKCAGRDFNITNCAYDPIHDRWVLTLDRLEDTSVGMVFPNIAYPIEAGDRFVLTDILMPEVYIIVAGKKLLARARVYYDQHSKLKYLYDLEVDSKWMGSRGAVLFPGMYMQIVDSDLIGANPEYVLIDTVTITENDSNIPVYKVTLREKLYLPE